MTLKHQNIKPKNNKPSLLLAISKKIKQYNTLGCEYIPGLMPGLNKSKNQKTSGFTIVELLVVIVIIGILAAITIVSYTGIASKANQASLQSELANAAKKLAMYYAENDTYPTNINMSNGCPTLPVASSSYCIKFSTGTKFIYNFKTASTYELDATKGSLIYEVTNTSAPIVSPNWLIVGNQTWAKFNLNVGTRVASTTEQSNNGGTNVVEKYCYGNTDAGCTNIDANGIVYGGLYQWDEAMQYSTTEGAQGICPAGSHIPSDNDWKILEVQLGMTQAQADVELAWRGTDQGARLKSDGSSGLNVPFAGYRDAAGAFFYLSSFANLWSSSGSGNNAWRRYLATSQADVYRSMGTKLNGFSVRCLGN